MIASRNGVIIAWLVAIILALLLALGRGTPEPSERVLVPGLDLDAITAMSWIGPKGFRIERDPASSTGWRWTHPVAEADRQAIEDVLAALRGATWHRRAEPAAAGTPGVTLQIEAGGPSPIAIAIGQPLGEEQRWIVIDDHALLVDAWVARAIAPDPVAFRIRPFARVAQAEQIEVGSFVLTGTPRRITKLAGVPIELLANATAVEQLERALGDISIVAIPNGKVPVDNNFRGTRVGLDGKLVAVEAGMCPVPDREHHAIFGPAIGPSCVAEPAWQSLIAAASVFDLPSDPAARRTSLAALVERRPVPVEPTQIVLGDRSTLDLDKRARITDPTGARDADPVKVAELLAVLATPAEPVDLPTTPPIARLEVKTATTRAPGVATLQLAVYSGGIVARHNEPIGLRVGDGSAAILARPGSAYVDRTLWSEEPTTVHSLQLGGVTYTRGAVVGEWTRVPAGAVDAATVEQLVGLLADLRSTGEATAPIDPMPVILAIVPPAGSPSERKLLLGRDARCAATLTAGSVALDPQICRLAKKLAK